ncbi:hypothetical protein CYLTODRAFT_457813 [Cylindrobasidium torrendii FP15055 ss-10]|uniref:Glycoside hydrolase family 16 protein n=1 Tax=Cylindrobasidium torrendii FP15055 ss-10 TaxID=1314674 RepID=A0A0D7B0R4_9AGAR|nr:hypothetical protein CYLTODRAFT_457813 [Cylindrobasidium torrendii FP15055 ss-10]
MLRSFLSISGLALAITLISMLASTTTVQASCTPFRTDFKTLDGFHHIGHDNQYALTGNGLELYIERPSGRVKSKDGVNDKLATGSTVNSTFSFSFPRVDALLATFPATNLF